MSAQIEDQPTLAQPTWERLAAERLTVLLSFDQLESLLGPFRNLLRQFRYRTTGDDRRGNKSDFAKALLLQRGIDLLAHKEIRTAVAAACKVTAPAHWRAGKQQSLDFVQATGFPIELAGTPNDDCREDFIYLEPRVRLRALHPFQREVKRKVKETLQQSGGRGNLTLPTGAGKTRVAVEAICEWLTERHAELPHDAPGKTVVWLAHTEELCEQAFSCFKQVWEASSEACPLHLIRFWSQYCTKLANSNFDLGHFFTAPSVLISTPQRMLNELQSSASVNRIGNAFRDAVGALFVDEAHRAGAPTYRQITSLLLTDNSPVSVIGLTATPFCKEYLPASDEGALALKAIFKKLIEPSTTLGNHPRRELELCGVLAKPVFEPIVTNAKILLPAGRSPEPLSESEMQTLDKELAKQTDLEKRRFAILNHILPIARNPQNSLLYFGPSVPDAEHMAYLLRIAHVDAAVISAKTRHSARNEIIQRFRDGKIRVLCNCEVLTVGFDAPRVTHLVMARPTSSRVMYEQIIGRGLRGPKFGGTKTCTVLNCEDDYPNGRPELGYESFRRIWEYEEEAADLSEAQNLRDAFMFSPTPTGQKLAKQAAQRLVCLDKVCAMLQAEFGPLNMR